MNSIHAVFVSFLLPKSYEVIIGHLPKVIWPENSRTGFQPTSFWRMQNLVFFYFKILYVSKFKTYINDFIYLFLDGEREKERERNLHSGEKPRSVASCMRPIRETDPHPKHVPWPGIKRPPFTFRGDTQPTEAHWSGLKLALMHAHNWKVKWKARW